MKVVDKRLIFINSAERTSGQIEGFTIELPPHLLQHQAHQRTRLILNDLVLPYTWYNVQATNRELQLTEYKVVQGQTVATAVTFQLAIGSYHAIQLQNHLQKLFDQSRISTAPDSLSYNYIISYEEVSGKFSFRVVADSVLPQQPVLSLSASVGRLLGFNELQNQFVNNVLVSHKPINMMFSEALFLHIDLPNNNINKSAGNQESFHVSTAFAKIPINTSPFNNIIYTNFNDDYLLNNNDAVLNTLRFTIMTAEHEPIQLNDDYSLTLKLEVLEDDEKQLMRQNTGIGELLKILILQNRALLNQKLQ